ARAISRGLAGAAAPVTAAPAPRQLFTMPPRRRPRRAVVAFRPVPGGTAPPPAPGSLIVSIASKAGTDDYGTAFPQGLKATAGVIEGPVLIGSNAFYYSGAGTPALGALIASVAASAGTDTAGNAYLAGTASYGGTAPHLFATANTGGTVQFWTAASAAGPWSFYGEIEIAPSTPGELVLSFTSISGAINTPQASGASAVLPLSLPAPAAYSQVYEGDIASAVNDIWNALLAAGILSS
ncbi:MAG TPA: hypothetical protein VKU39_21085, partial [Streptosporangiaceae bacterium]|nr:hypothetical protein [Streptosporangiaceae bacterium]